MKRTMRASCMSVGNATGWGTLFLGVLLSSGWPPIVHGQTPSFEHVSGSPFPVPGGTYKWVVALGDVNGDGHSDIVTMNHDSGTFTILLGDGAGAFAESPHSPVAAGSSLSENNMYQRDARLVLADVNGNGAPDIVSSGSYGLIVLLNNGAGMFAPASGSPFPTSLGGYNANKPARYPVVADMNNNGFLDVVCWGLGNTSFGYEGQILIYLNDGNGGFSLSPSSPVSPNQIYPGTTEGNFQNCLIATGDFNGDGLPDVVLTGRNFSGIEYPVLVMLGDGHGGLVAAPGGHYAFVYPNALQMTVGDINHDGADDIIISSRIRSLEYGDDRDPDMFRLLINDGTGRFTLNTDTQSNRSSALAAGDVTGDGIADVLSVDDTLWGLRVWPGSADGLALQGTTVLNVINSIDWPVALALGDINGNGKLDLVATHRNASSAHIMSVLRNTTAGDFAPAIEPPRTVGGQVDKPFAFAIPATGTRPITFTASPLPAGLSLAGDTISGTPAQVGQTRVTLTAHNSAGSATNTLTITITDPANSPPQITGGPFATPNPAGVDRPVSFSVTASDPDGDPLSYLWNFGDGTTSTEASPTRSYATNGVFVVGLTVMDGKGGSAFGGVTVTVSDLKPGDLNGDGVVNVDDVTLVTSHWGMTPDNPNWDARADANGDGVVNEADLAIVKEHFGTKYE